jgi:hypothetical protein
MIQIRSKKRQNEEGYLIILSFIVVFALMAIGLSIAGAMGNQYTSTKRNTYVENAVSTAEAGVSASIAQLNANGSFAGYTTRQTLYNSATRGRSEYTTTVTTNADGTKTIVSTGYTYATQSDTNPINTKTIKVIAKSTPQSIKAALVAGPGGLVLAQGIISAKNLYVNGQVSLASGTSLGMGGFTLTPTDINLTVSNMGCGSGASYPQPCAGQPISIAGTGAIYGTVCAPGQSADSRIQTGISGQGLLSSCSAPAVTMPQFDRSGAYNTMYTANGTKAISSIGSCGAFGGSLTLAKNQIYTGSLNISGGGCKATITGDTYITGDVNVSFFANLQVDNSLTSPPIVYVDGNITFNNGGIYKNASGIGAILISFKSSNSSCDHTCNSLSATDLYNSVNTTTALCSQSFCSMNGSTLYSYFGTAAVQGGTGVSGIAGQRIYVFSLSTILTDAVDKNGLIDGDAFGGRAAIPSWKVVDYQQTYP